MFDLTPGVLFLSILYGSIGFGYIVYGKKNSLYFVLAGIALIICTYVISQFITLLLVGLALTVIPFIIEKYFS